MPTKELVIAAYDKDLSWMHNLNKDIKKTIYRKGNVLQLSKDEVLVEPNFGRCVHTFFNHIKNNYNNLSDYTFFAQDYPFDHWEDLIEIVNGDSEFIKNRCALNIAGYYGFHFNTIRVPSDKGGIMWCMHESKHHNSGKVISCHSNGMPQDHNPNINVDDYWNILFNHPTPDIYEFIPGGHFCITSEHAKLRPLSFYSKITDLLEKNPTAPWIIERLECYIFNPNFIIK